MYRTILFIFITVVVGINVSYPQDNHLGVKGGISLPKLSSGSDNELSKDYKSRVAVNAGVFLEMGITEKISIQTEVNFAGNGGKRKGIQPITSTVPGLPPLPNGSYYYADFENEAILNYLEVPVLVKYRFKPESKTRLYVNGGAYYGRLLNAKTKTSGDSTIYLDSEGNTPILLPPKGQPLPPISFDAETDIEDDLNKNNVGLTGGGGVEFAKGNGYFFVDGRVSYGLRSIQKDTIRNGNNRSGGLIFSVGYAFKFGK